MEGPPKGAGRYVALEDRSESNTGGLSDDEPSDVKTNGGSSTIAPPPKVRRRKSTKSNIKQGVDIGIHQVSSQPDPYHLQLSQDQYPHNDLNLDQSQLHDFNLGQQHRQPPLQQLPLHYQNGGNPFQLHQQQHQQLRQQFIHHQQPQPNILDLQLDSQVPLGVQGLQDPHMVNSMHQRETKFTAFNSPSPAHGSEHSVGDRSPGADVLPRLGINTPPFTDLDDLEEDMGHLTLDHKGHERYVGKSSPMFYNRRHWGGYSIREREQPEARKFVENPDLPPPEMMTHLLNLHFTYVHPFAPVFIWSRFLKRLQERDYTPSFLFLLNSIFALASRFSDDISLRTDPDKPETVGAHFVEKSKAILDTLYDAPDLYCVGALVLLSYQQMGTGGGYRAWMFVGLSIRMAQHLGLNRDCAKLNPHMPVLDREERNRIWWTCFVADRVVSASFGRPQGINEHDVDATYPEGIDEENIQLEYKLDNAASMLTGPSPDSEKNFAYMASLTRIMGRVMVSLYSPLSKASSLSAQSMSNSGPLEQLDRELTEWLLTLPPHLQFRSVQQESGTFVCTLHMTFYVTLILLHKPYSHQSIHHSPGDSSISLSICTSAANNTIEMASNLMRISDDHRSVPRLKCLLHSIVFILFTAGLVHITNCTSTDPVLAASAKLRTVETLRCLKTIETVWISGKWCGNNIKNLLKARNIELPCSVDEFNVIPRNGIDPSVILSERESDHPAQVPSTAYTIPKEESFAFDVDQIMGYYQGNATRHTEPKGRNSRHFSPTPYFSPDSPHHSSHSQSSSRQHPGLSQGHSPLPRRPRQTKNTSPSPGLPSNPLATPMSSNVPSTSLAGNIYTSLVSDAAAAAVMGVVDPNYYSTTLTDPFASPGSATIIDSQGQPQPQSQHRPSPDNSAVKPEGNPTFDSNAYQNPFSATLWSLPTATHNEEWMLYMQNGGAGASGKVDQHNLKESGSVPGMADEAIGGHVRSNSLSGRMHPHPLAQSLTRNELLLSSKFSSVGSEGGSSSTTTSSTLVPSISSAGDLGLRLNQTGSKDEISTKSISPAAMVVSSSLPSSTVTTAPTLASHNFSHHQHHQHQQQQQILTSQRTGEYEYFMARNPTAHMHTPPPPVTAHLQGAHEWRG
ncbi:hypothetical protein BGZ92_000782 [Podila epicladia]|nr:hypothetical protein BGZ92_000782 [Podila epicladia]